MKLSAPIYRLKSQAKNLKKQRNISLSLALDEVATQQGFASWSRLMSRRELLLPLRFSEVAGYFNRGDLVLVAARPGVGKSIFAAGLIAQSIAAKGPVNYVFTLVEGADQWRSRLGAYVQSAEALRHCDIDCSNTISADYIIAILSDRLCPGAVIVVDYLQMLDEKRINAPLQQQVLALQKFARSTGCTIVFLCQIDRAITDRVEQHPTVADIRLPNPLELGLFNKIILLSADLEAVRVRIAAPVDHTFNVHWDKEQLRFTDLE